jgi:PadR family transcriptional regulator, regulatory protein PadR
MAPPPITGATLDVLALMFDAWERDQELYGWAIMKRLRRSGPAIYAVLDRLEDAGWIAGSWEVLPLDAAMRPRRRLYRLTGQGVDAARRSLHAHVSGKFRRLVPRPGVSMPSLGEAG